MRENLENKAAIVQQIEDSIALNKALITASHIICYLVERSLFGTNQHISTSSNSRQRKALPKIGGNFI
jgi:hypothetical protein